jgi:hypothetical protein
VIRFFLAVTKPEGTLFCSQRAVTVSHINPLDFFLNISSRYNLKVFFHLRLYFPSGFVSFPLIFSFKISYKLLSLTRSLYDPPITSFLMYYDAVLNVRDVKALVAVCNVTLPRYVPVTGRNIFSSVCSWAPSVLAHSLHWKRHPSFTHYMCRCRHVYIYVQTE